MKTLYRTGEVPDANNQKPDESGISHQWGNSEPLIHSVISDHQHIDIRPIFSRTTGGLSQKKNNKRNKITEGKTAAPSSFNAQCKHFRLLQQLASTASEKSQCTKRKRWLLKISLSSCEQEETDCTYRNGSLCHMNCTVALSS